jgi:hypothetical protein
MTPMPLQGGTQFNFGGMLPPSVAGGEQLMRPIGRPIGSTLNLGTLMHPPVANPPQRILPAQPGPMPQPVGGPPQRILPPGAPPVTAGPWGGNPPQRIVPPGVMQPQPVGPAPFQPGAPYSPLDFLNPFSPHNR